MVRQETVVDKSIYYDQAIDFKDEETGEYYPLRVRTRSMFYQTFKPSNSIESDIVDILDIRLTIGSIEMDDSMLQLGMQHRDKQFVQYDHPQYI